MRKFFLSCAVGEETYKLGRYFIDESAVEECLECMGKDIYYLCLLGRLVLNEELIQKAVNKVY